MKLHNTASKIVLIAVTGAAGACTVDTPETATTQDDILGGTETTGYPETVLIDVLTGSGSWGKQCTGVALAPSVVLTAAHCFAGVSKFRVVVPSTGQSIETSSKAGYPDFKDGKNDRTAASGYDAGLLFLPSKIDLPASRFPHLSPRFTRSTETVRALGRTLSGVLSANKIYISPTRTFTDVIWAPYPKYYLFSSPTLEPGDSGGPVIRMDPARHVVVGVNSAGNSSASIATRVDTIYDWIITQIQSYTASHRSLAPACGTGFACELSPIGGGLPCVAGSTLAYCCDIAGQGIENGHCTGAGETPPPGDGPPDVPPTSGPGVVMWDIAGHVRNQNLAGVPGVKVQVWGYDESGHWDHYDSVTDSAGNFKVGGFIVKGGTYEVRVENNELRRGSGSYKYPAFTSWLSHTRDQLTKKDTPLGSTAYLNQKAGSDDCAGPDTTRSGNKRCDFIYTTDANPAHLYPPAPTGLRTTCDLTTPSKPKATIWWNAQPRATLGYYIRVDHRPNSFDTTSCTGGAGSIGRVDPFDRCVDGTTHTSLTVGPIELNAPYYAWAHAANVEGAFSTPPSAFTFKCP